jgi:site-specific recombinase
LESTRDLIVSLFPENQRGNASLRGLANRVDLLVRADTLRDRLDAFVDLFGWLRVKDARIPPPLSTVPGPAGWGGAEWQREKVWLSVLGASPEVGDKVRVAMGSILEGTDGVSLFAESGLPSDRGLLPETFDRLFRILLPAPREETDLARLFLRLFPTQKEVDRFFDLPPEVLEQIVFYMAPAGDSPTWKKPLENLTDAFCLLGARVQGLGLSEKLRSRGQRTRVQDSAFYRLTRTADALVGTWKDNEPAEVVAGAAQNWKATVGECRAELETIVAHLDARGVNLDVVYAMDVIEKSLSRMEVIAGVLVAQTGPAKAVTTQRLVREVVRGRLADISIVSLAHNSTRLLAKKIVEWAGKTGERYIATDRSEYFQMWRAALGGGLLTVGTATIKMVVTHFGLPLFVEGFLAGLNYAISFVLLQNYHLALATKQPSMTGAALARIIHGRRDALHRDELVTYTTRIVRSQLAAAMGNILAVSAGCIVFSIIWKAAVGHPFLHEDTAMHAVDSMNPFRSGTVFYAIITGIILWLSSLAGGWIENWAVYHQLPKAISEHRLGANFHPDTLQRISISFSRNIAGWGGSIALGFMLGMTPVFGKFLGLPLDVRHVTLSSGTLTLGTSSLGLAAVGKGKLLLAWLGIAFTFVMNLGVSFYLALRLALSSQDVSHADKAQMRRALWRHFLECPRDYFFPPPQEPTPAPEPST